MQLLLVVAVCLAMLLLLTVPTVSVVVPRMPPSLWVERERDGEAASGRERLAVTRTHASSGPVDAGRPRRATHQHDGPVLARTVENPKPHDGAERHADALVQGVHVRLVKVWEGGGGGGYAGRVGNDEEVRRN